MRLKIMFQPQTSLQTSNVMNHQIYGFINKILGEDNKWHGQPNQVHSISTMQGGVPDKTGILQYPNGGYIFVSSPDDEFMMAVMRGVDFADDDISIGSMRLAGTERCSIEDFQPLDKFDIVRTICPLYIKNADNRSILFSDPEFISLLTEKSRKKLLKFGLGEQTANSLEFQLFHPENAKVSTVTVHKQINIASRVMLVVKGSKNARKTLYEMGLGKSTCFGFGAVTINRQK
jgi:CRISPR-associated endoribonuclease Cas6